MSETTGALPRAKIEKSRIAWVLWLIPIAAAGLCGWFIVRDVVLQGPTITIYFPSIDGLAKQTSFLEYRGVVVGQVTGIKLTPDKIEPLRAKLALNEVVYRQFYLKQETVTA